PGGAVPVEDADVVPVAGPPGAGRHHRGPKVGEPLADRPSLFALAEPPNLVVLKSVAVLVHDHVGVLGVVHATAAVFDLAGCGREERVVVSERVSDDDLGPLVDPLSAACAKSEALDVALGAIDVEVGHQGLEAVLRPLDPPPIEPPLAHLPRVGADHRVYPFAVQTPLAPPDVVKRDRMTQRGQPAVVLVVAVPKRG